MSLQGKVVVVTGAGQGIGEAYARSFAAAGAAVVVVELNEENGRAVSESIVGDGGSALFVKCDVSNPEDAAGVARAVKEHFGRLDALINNAAIYHDMQYASLLEVDLDYYYTIMRVNMHSPLIMARALVPLLEADGGGCIVNQSSTAAYKPVGGYYGIAKLGVQGLTMCLASELGAKNIRVNAIAPGPVDTAATRLVPAEILDQVVAGLALGRLGNTADIVSMAKYLCSDEAAWITGQIFRVDGGDTMLPA